MSWKVPSVCPVCGAHSLTPEGDRSILLAVCDVLVLKALEKMGNYIVRAERARFNVIGKRPMHIAHTLWQPTDQIVDKALRGAWDVVPAILDVHGCCGVTSKGVTEMLDSYVHDLAITATRHTLTELHYRFEKGLGMPVFDHEVEHEHDQDDDDEQAADPASSDAEALADLQRRYGNGPHAQGTSDMDQVVHAMRRAG